jgi:hypothetical protein
MLLCLHSMNYYREKKTEIERLDAPNTKAGRPIAVP